MISAFHYSIPALAREVALEEGLVNISDSYDAATDRDDLEWLGIRRSRGWEHSKYRSME